MEVMFARKCENCSKGMNEGFIYEDGAYCSYNCLPITEAQWNASYSDNGENYWTEWDEYDDTAFTRQGKEWDLATGELV